MNHHQCKKSCNRTSPDDPSEGGAGVLVDMLGQAGSQCCPTHDENRVLTAYCHVACGQPDGPHQVCEGHDLTPAQARMSG
jgi:hypothetical protein